MNLDELKSQLPEQIQPWVSQFGPIFIAMTAEQFKNWIDLLAKGDNYTAYKSIIEKLNNQELLNEWTAIEAKWKTANINNVANIDVQNKAIAAILRIMLSIAVAAVGV